MIYEILRQRRDIILKRWKDEVLSRYSGGHFKPPRNKNDRFGNPVVYSFSTGLEVIFDELTAEIHTAKLDEALEEIVKIKSLQTEKPSDAIDFLPGLKKIIHDELANSRDKDNSSESIQRLYFDIDGLIFSAFDIFMKCREKIYEIKSKEVLRRSYRLLERANMMGPSLQNEGDNNDKTD